MSYLYYADRIYQINLAIAGIAIGVVILPHSFKTYLFKKGKNIYNLVKAIHKHVIKSTSTNALFVGSEEIISAFSVMVLLETICI